MGDFDSPLTAVERQSVSRATQLIRDAGWPEKAGRLDDFLQQGKIVTTTDAASIFVAGHANKDLIGLPSVGVNPPHLHVPGHRDTPLSRQNPELIRLAAILLHEADHTLCHGDIEAYGEMISFGETLVELLDRLFAELTPDEKAAARQEAETTSRWGRTGRDRYVDKEPPDPPPLPSSSKPGKPKAEVHKLVLPGLGAFRVVVAEMADLSYPPPSATRVEQDLDQIAAAILEYRRQNGTYPSGDNAAMVRALGESSPLPARLLDPRGTVVDPWGRPFVYLFPGRVYPQHFDLYSLGHCGVDSQGTADNILCVLDRL
jgi:hypothetical protein